MGQLCIEHYDAKRISKSFNCFSDVVFRDGVIGKAQRGVMCSYKQSGGVNMDHSHHAQAVAATVAHEMGHNFGCEHDTDVTSGCACASPTDKCIMAPMTRCAAVRNVLDGCMYAVVSRLPYGPNAAWRQLRTRYRTAWIIVC